MPDDRTRAELRLRLVLRVHSALLVPVGVAHVARGSR
jgi:hypothetical protein